MLNRVNIIAANTLLYLGATKGYRKWRSSVHNVRSRQQNVLFQILKRNAKAQFGKEHKFNTIKSIVEYQQFVPLRSYIDFEPYIQQMVAGQTDILTSDKLLLFERSSGSTSASKLIPYTLSLKKEFQYGINAWLYLLYAHNPRLLTGKHYWSASPVGQEKNYTSGGIPIGFEEDSEYFGGVKRLLVESVMAVPSAVSRIQDIETFRYVTLRFLLQCKDLVFISVWNPSFLMLILNALPGWIDTLIVDITNGTITPPQKLDASLLADLKRQLTADKDRATEISELYQSWQNKSLETVAAQEQTFYEALWPRLTQISCWADASAHEPALRLQTMFPHTRIEPKGLLATEAFVSFPLGQDLGNALSVCSHFFEFIEIEASAEAKNIKLAHEITEGKQYSVVVTTSGGLYRYQLQDRVEVTGFFGECPLVRFLGKEDAVVDLFGEKLNEYHVHQVLAELFSVRGIKPLFNLLAPMRNDDYSGRYVLFIQLPSDVKSENMCQQLDKLVDELDKRLAENFHYQYCRKLGQLKSPRVFVISEEVDPNEIFVKTCNTLGQRLGNIKPKILHSFTNWCKVFPEKIINYECER